MFSSTVSAIFAVQLAVNLNFVQRSLCLTSPCFSSGKKFSNDGKIVTKTQMLYQIGRKPKTVQELRKIVSKYLSGTLGAQDIKFLKTKVWEYFPRWNPEELVEGKPWQVRSAVFSSHFNLQTIFYT